MNAPKKSLGQHWLHDLYSLRQMADAAHVGPDDTVLEIGPGLGTLTAELADRARRVIAVEFDTELAAGLNARVPSENVEVVHQDILKFDLTKLPRDYKVAANLPYYITSKIVRMLLESPNPPLESALLVQKEVAQRMAAAPGDMSILAVAVQLYAEPVLGPLVPAELFTPPPKVDSQIIGLKRRAKPLFDDIEPEDYFFVVKAGFSEKRKTLRNSLSGGLRIDKSTAEEMLETAKVSAKARAEELSLDDWYRLAKVYTSSEMRVQ
jgi:16S rRNA (adenine1518-N6/adenine1519-N6)-dimethyltransferase